MSWCSYMRSKWGKDQGKGGKREEEGDSEREDQTGATIWIWYVRLLSLSVTQSKNMHSSQTKHNNFEFSHNTFSGIAVVEKKITSPLWKFGVISIHSQLLRLSSLPFLPANHSVWVFSDVTAELRAAAQDWTSRSGVANVKKILWCNILPVLTDR